MKVISDFGSDRGRDITGLDAHGLAWVTLPELSAVDEADLRIAQRYVLEQTHGSSGPERMAVGARVLAPLWRGCWTDADAPLPEAEPMYAFEVLQFAPNSTASPRTRLPLRPSCPPRCDRSTTTSPWRPIPCSGTGTCNAPRK